MKDASVFFAIELTAANPPDVALLRHSIADSLRRKVPFVVTFGTPAFCESRACGPTVDVVGDRQEAVPDERDPFYPRRDYTRTISPETGVNRWLREWKLPTEPWVHVIERKGMVRDRFEGTVSVVELERSIRRNILN